MKRCCIRAITLLAEEKLYSPVSDRFILWFLGSNITLTLLTEPSCVREGESKELSALSTSPRTMLKCDLMLSLLAQRNAGDSCVCFYIRMKKKNLSSSKLNNNNNNNSGPLFRNYFQPKIYIHLKFSKTCCINCIKYKIKPQMWKDLMFLSTSFFKMIIL